MHSHCADKRHRLNNSKSTPTNYAHLQHRPLRDQERNGLALVRAATFGYRLEPLVPRQTVQSADVALRHRLVEERRTAAQAQRGGDAAAHLAQGARVHREVRVHRLCVELALAPLGGHVAHTVAGHRPVDQHIDVAGRVRGHQIEAVAQHVHGVQLVVDELRRGAVLVELDLVSTCSHGIFFELWKIRMVILCRTWLVVNLFTRLLFCVAVSPKILINIIN